VPAKEGMPTISIVTATYQLAHTLPETYESLKAQSFKDIEWIIVDDGSSDETEELVKSWLGSSPFPIYYSYQKNQGKHFAVNKGIRQAKGEFTTLLDADDTFLPNALERFLYYWQSIPENEREQFAGVTGLCVNAKQELLGGKFKQDVLDSNSLEISYIYRLGDDRHGMGRTDILKAYPFPEIRERYVTEGVVWNRIARQYKTRYFNEVVQVKEYRPEGMTSSIRSYLTRSAKSTTLYYQEMLKDKLPFSPLVRAWHHASYVRYSLHANYNLSKILKDGSKHLLLMPLGLVAGSLLFLRDEVKGVKKAPPAKKLAHA
jgi:glycosyltransferase involved in cell wall biosynthesis